MTLPQLSFRAERGISTLDRRSEILHFVQDDMKVSQDDMKRSQDDVKGGSG